MNNLKEYILDNKIISSIDDYIIEKFKISKDINIDDDRRFIMKWTDLIEMHYADWVKDYEDKARYDIKKTTDEEIKKEMNELIKWLDDHYKKPELWNFEHSKIAVDFKRYLEKNKYLI